MALNPNELFSETTRAAPKRIYPTHSKPKKFAAGSGTLAAGSLVTFDTSALTWKKWTNGGANGTGDMQGILWPDPVTLDADEEVLGMVMLTGHAHRDDIELNGESQSNLDAELASSARVLGIHIDGLKNVR